MRKLPLLLLLVPGVAQAESFVPDDIVAEIDLLVVLDSSPTAAAARAELAQQIGGFVASIEAELPSDTGDSRVSWHIGFVTSDLGAGPQCGAGDGARLQIASPSCLEPGATEAWVVAETDRWGTRTGNISGSTADAVACALPVTLDGCAIQQPMRATRLALDGSVAANAGFLRPDAALAVLYVSTQDDCSADPSFFTAGTTRLSCALAGWTCMPALTGSPQVPDGCTANDDATALEPWQNGAAFLNTLKDPEAGLITVAAIAGPDHPVEVLSAGVLAPSCGAGTDRAATPAMRLPGLTVQFGGPVGSVCEDLSLTLDAWRNNVVWAADHEHYFPPACDGGLGGGGDDSGDDVGGAPAESTGSRFGCTTGGGGGLGALLLLSLAAATARRGCRRGR